MTKTKLKYRDWEFEVYRELTQQNYENIIGSGADGCECNDCKNYVAYRDNVFPDEIRQLFDSLGIDYKKEVEITSWEILPNGLHHIGGWFQFKGHILTGKDCRIPFPSGGYTLDLTTIEDNFSIGFFNGNTSTYFADNDKLVQIEFATFIPWVIDKSLETECG
jgi:hypothetical protein